MAIATEIGSLAWENERPMSVGLTGRIEKQRGWGLLLDPSGRPPEVDVTDLGVAFALRSDRGITRWRGW
jgi:hypothetical protein